MKTDKIMSVFCNECEKDKFNSCNIKNSFILEDKIPPQWERVESACMSFIRKKIPTFYKNKNINDNSLF